MAICIPTFTGYINHQNHFALKLRELHLQRNLLKKVVFNVAFILRWQLMKHSYNIDTTKNKM